MRRGQGKRRGGFKSEAIGCGAGVKIDLRGAEKEYDC